MFQSLESRRLFAAQIGLSNGLVTVTGSDTLRDEVTMTFIDGKVIGDTGRDDLRIDVIQRNSAGKQVSSVSRQFSLFDVTGIKVDTRGGDDKVLATNVFDVEGGIRNITVLGGSGNDEVKGDYEQMTFIDGGSGNDSLGHGKTIRGGTGNDYIYGSRSRGSESGGRSESLYGDAGQDTIDGNGGSDYIDGGVSDDTISQTVGFYDVAQSTILGGDGNDKIDVVGGFRSILGGAGGDHITVHSYFESDESEAFDQDNLHNRGDILGENGSDTIRLQSLTLQPGSPVRVFGGTHNDTITGSDKGDYLLGGEGDDVIDGRAGNDSIYGEAGNDKLFGGAGRDFIYGGAGYDVLTANDGQRDVLDGGNDGISDRFIKDVLDQVVG